MAVAASVLKNWSIYAIWLLWSATSNLNWSFLGIWRVWSGFRVKTCNISIFRKFSSIFKKKFFLRDAHTNTHALTIAHEKFRKYLFRTNRLSQRAGNEKVARTKLGLGRISVTRLIVLVRTKLYRSIKNIASRYADECFSLSFHRKSNKLKQAYSLAASVRKWRTTNNSLCVGTTSTQISQPVSTSRYAVETLSMSH